jgi:outer membrane lipoprotein-sorting protein
MIARALAAIAAIGFVASATAASAPLPDSAYALLQAAADAPRHVSFVGQVELMTIGSHGAQASVFRVDHRAPNLTRRWYVSPPNVYGDWTVAKNDAEYAVDVKRHRIVVTDNDGFGVHYGWHRDLALLRRNYRAATGRDVVIAGRAAHTVILINRYTGQTTMRLWVDAQTGLMLQRQVFSSLGSMVMQMHFDDVRFTNAIPLSTFALPASYPVVAGPSRGDPSTDPSAVMARAGFAARGPRFLPEGFTAVAADLGDENGVRTLHLLYSDGIRTFSLFENARGAAVNMAGYTPVPFTLGSLRGESVDEGPTTLLAWSRGHLHFALVGELNRDELEQIAASIAP